MALPGKTTRKRVHGVLDKDALNDDALDGDTLNRDALDRDVPDDDVLNRDAPDGSTPDGNVLDGDTLNRDALDDNLREPAQNHLQRLILGLNMLADISFGDVLVFAKDERLAKNDGLDASDFYVLGHARPINSSTVHYTDIVESNLDNKRHPFVTQAYETAQIRDGGIFSQEQNHWIQTLAVPINFMGNIIGVMVCEKRPLATRDIGQLETSYFSAFRRLAQMVADGTYPFPPEPLEHEHPPRVGDGLMILDGQQNAEYLSPNAHSALRRIGIIENSTTKHIDIHKLPTLVDISKTRLPCTDEIEANGSTVVLRCLPLLAKEKVTGTLVLLRDITELRRRDRLLLTKDATIAEIHHRVKNNLQTISSLLQLQSRRLATKEGRFAILESARRIRSIAIVHDILAHETTGEVQYGEILKSLVAEIREALISPEIPIELEIRGSVGNIPSDMASSLALVMSELIQNAIDHAFGDGLERNPKIVIEFQRFTGELNTRTELNGQTNGQTDGQINGELNGQTDGQSNGQADNHTNDRDRIDGGKTSSQSSSQHGTQINDHTTDQIDRRHTADQIDRQARERLEIAISDNGVGIPQDFSIDESPGLGLTIVRTLMEADLRGMIEIIKPTKGTTIKLHFPLGRI